MTQSAARDRLIVALDLDARQSLDLAHALAGEVRWVKVGMTLFYQAGPAIVQELRGLGFDVFLDLKLHDIPHQVAGAAKVVAALGVQMLTVHASGGEAMIAAAVQGSNEGALGAGSPPPIVLAVTVLTSMSAVELGSVGVLGGVADQVDTLARVAQRAGAHGVVCSPQEIARMRTVLGDSGYIVTPGVRPAGADLGDQSRVATPAQAVSSGASHLVVGRPITAASSPIQAVRSIIAEMEG